MESLCALIIFSRCYQPYEHKINSKNIVQIPVLYCSNVSIMSHAFFWFVSSRSERRTHSVSSGGSRGDLATGLAGGLVEDGRVAAVLALIATAVVSGEGRRPEGIGSGRSLSVSSSGSLLHTSIAVLLLSVDLAAVWKRNIECLSVSLSLCLCLSVYLSSFISIPGYSFQLTTTMMTVMLALDQREGGVDGAVVH